MLVCLAAKYPASDAFIFTSLPATAWHQPVATGRVDRRRTIPEDKLTAADIEPMTQPKLTPHQQREAIRRRDREGEPVREIARTFNVSHSTISRLKA